MSSMESVPVKHGVLICPLHTHANEDELATEILKLMKTVHVHSSEISRLVVCSEAGYARIEVYKKRCEDQIVRSLAKAIKGGLYNLNHLLEKPEQLNVVRMEQPRDQELCRGMAVFNPEKEHLESGQMTSIFKSEEERLTTLDEYSKPGDCKTGLRNATINSRKRDSAKMKTNATATKDKKKQRTNSLAVPGEGAVDSSVDTPGNIQSAYHVLNSSRVYSETIYYIKFQKIISETKHSKFMNGAIAHDEVQFRDQVGEYVADLLNSQGGTIYVGVNDKGVIGGILLDRLLEMHLCMDTNFAVRYISPEVKPSEFSITFAGLLEENGELVPHLKVLVIRVMPSRESKVVYSYDCSIYCARTGKKQRTRSLDCIIPTELRAKKITHTHEGSI